MRTCRRDHPRMRGEHPDLLRIYLDATGSSPHARGAPLAVTVDARFRGIIPACAGSTRPAFLLLPPGRDHPRMRGEHGKTVDTVVYPQGSSPHARGAPDRHSA